MRNEQIEFYLQSFNTSLTDISILALANRAKSKLKLALNTNEVIVN